MKEKYRDIFRIPSARLQGYDYGQNGAYFITICTKGLWNYFGEIVEEKTKETQYETQDIASLRATPIGAIAQEYWQKIPEHFSFILLREYVVMPNHVHGILVISKETNAGSGTEVETQYFASDGHIQNIFGPQSGNISSVVRGYKASIKAFATKNKIDFEWQPRFHDHIIRNDNEMQRIGRYIVENPKNWFQDKNNTEGLYM